MATDGISRLIAVTQMKSENANDEALSGADKQRSLVTEQKSVRPAQSGFDEMVRDGSYGDLFPGGLTAVDRGVEEASVSTPAIYLDRFSKSGFETSSLFSSAELVKNLEVVGSSSTRYASGLHSIIEALKKGFEDSGQDLEAKDKLGNFEIQDLMSSYNQAETLASSTKKKLDDASSSVLSNIG